jgi:ribosomal protein S18 acetylase RimI-like enzyme
MSAAGLLSARQPTSGLRPFQPRSDLATVADLVETCFAASLDAAGRSAIQEMRLLSRTGPLLWLLARLNHAIPLMRGFVWVEQGRLVGNVSLASAGFDNGWVIANVAVYPQYRRQGIARQLMQAALDWVDSRGVFATLQVDADNDGARALYESLGFESQRTFTRWRRASYLRPPDRLGDLPPIRRPARGEADRLYELAACVRPNELGGMGWLRPTQRSDFVLSWLNVVRLALSGQRSDFWMVPGQPGEIAAALRLESRIGVPTTTFDLLVHPDHQGQLEAPLINQTLREFAGRRSPLLTDHPADDRAACDVYRRCDFRAERTLLHMIRPPKQERNSTS